MFCKLLSFSLSESSSGVLKYYMKTGTDGIFSRLNIEIHSIGHFECDFCFRFSSSVHAFFAHPENKKAPRFISAELLPISLSLAFSLTQLRFYSKIEYFFVCLPVYGIFFSHERTKRLHTRIWTRRLSTLLLRMIMIMTMTSTILS